MTEQEGYTIDEIAKFLNEGKITLEQYLEIMENIMGKKEFWEMHKKKMEQYFHGFEKVSAAKLPEFVKDENMGEPRIMKRGKF
jgi:hypothetical protein